MQFGSLFVLKTNARVVYACLLSYLCAIIPQTTKVVLTRADARSSADRTLNGIVCVVRR